MGKMVGGVMKVYDYDDEMWKAVNPDEWQQAYAKGGGIYTSDKIFVLEVRDGETNELLEEKVYRANRYSTALLDAEYDEDLFKKKYGDYLHFKLKEKYAKGGGVRNFTLADYKENEQINNHPENALMLTKMYGTQDEIFEVERLIKKGEREGGFSEVDYRRIYEISGKYYKHLVEASKRK